MSFDLILPFFPEELRELLLDPSISDLMINGTNGVFADRNGVVEQIVLTQPFTSERLQAAIERVARILGQDLTTQNRSSIRACPMAHAWPLSAHLLRSTADFYRTQIQPLFTSDELVAAGSLPAHVRDVVVQLIANRKNGIIAVEPAREKPR